MENEKAKNLIDTAIKNISGRELVSVAEITDLLLDIRLYLMTQESQLIPTDDN